LFAASCAVSALAPKGVNMVAAPAIKTHARWRILFIMCDPPPLVFGAAQIYAEAGRECKHSSFVRTFSWRPDFGLPGEYDCEQQSGDKDNASTPAGFVPEPEDRSLASSRPGNIHRRRQSEVSWP
jgi:hypothetical protein